MDQLIPVINKLQDVFNSIGIDTMDLPQIVVIGSQSSGKSSVLENIVGRDFLPRGSGIVTRRPLVLQLIHLPAEANKDPRHAEWGEFLHKPGQNFYDFNEIREEINKETDRLTGKNKGISHTPINLKIYSPHVLNLTLVDLPGITRVPVGDQPLDIEQQIRHMVLTYISKPNAVIVAVTAANTDLSNSDALQLAREVDPEGSRTIGVLTKIDLMDSGTNALDMLEGRVIPLRLGYVGVINRSQKDINERKPIQAALKAETDFFSSSPLYRSVSNRCGTLYLSRTLNKILMNHIKETLPELKSKINKLLAESQAEMSTYGDTLYDGKNSQGALLLQVITKFSSEFRNSIDGKSAEYSLQELNGGARINYIFTEVFARCVNELDPSEGSNLNAVRTALKNAAGTRAALFVPESAFDGLVKKQIARLEEPSLQCVELVYDELQRIVSQLESKELQRFANLRDKVVEVVNNLLQKCRTPTKIMIGNLVSIEVSYINTNHPDFVGGGGAVFEKMAMAHQQEQQTSQLQQMQQMQLLQQQQQQQMMMNNNNGNNNNNLNTQAANQALEAKTKKSGAAAAGANTNNPAAAKGSAVLQNTAPTNASGSNFFGLFFQDPNSTAGTAAPPKPAPPPSASTAVAPKKSRTAQGGSSSSSSMNRMGGGVEKLGPVPNTIKTLNVPNEKERFEIELIQNLLVSYFGIVRKNIVDSVPKSIMYFLVNQAKDNIQNELVQQLYKEELFDELLEESPAVAQRRRACKQMLDVLRRAQSILAEVRDTTF